MITSGSQRKLLPARLNQSFDFYFNDGDDLHSVVPTYIFDTIIFSARIFRCDTGQFFPLNEDGFMAPSNNQQWGVQKTSIGRIQSGLPRTNAALCAVGLWSKKFFEEFGMRLDYKISPVFPSGDISTRTDVDRWHEARYRLDDIKCSLFVSIMGGLIGVPEAVVTEDILILLEGLDWQ